MPSSSMTLKEYRNKHNVPAKRGSEVIVDYFGEHRLGRITCMLGNKPGILIHGEQSAQSWSIIRYLEN